MQGSAGNEPYLSPTQLERRFKGAHKDYEIREMARRSENPIPHIELGGKRRHIGIRESVYALFLDYEEGLITYDEVVEGARRRVAGARA